MSKTVSNILYNALRAATFPLSPRQKAKTLSRIAEKLTSLGDVAVTTNHGDLYFFAGRGSAVASSVVRFHNDEPETLYYIDNIIETGDIFFDIGANAGLYSIYAAKRGAVVYAFEPSAINFSLLVDHIRINDLSKQVKPLCIAFSNKNELADLKMAELSPGHASNSIGEARNQFGYFTPAFQQTVITLRLDTFSEMFGITPSHIKLDVDGIEPLIVAGGEKTLFSIKSLLIEIEGENAEKDAKIIEFIERAGLREDLNFRNLSAHGRNRLFLRS